MYSVASDQQAAGLDDAGHLDDGGARAVEAAEVFD